MSNAAIKMLRDIRSIEQTVENMRSTSPETFAAKGSAERLVQEAGVGPCGHDGIGFWAIDMSAHENTWEEMAREHQSPFR